MGTKKKLVAYVYGLRADDQDEYFYIGSTKFAPSHRLTQHWGLLSRNRNLHFVRKMKKIGREHVICDTLEIVARDRQFTSELEWIKRLDAQGANLTNLSRELRVAAANAQDEYEKSVSSAEFLLKHLPLLARPQIAADPRNQGLLDDVFSFGKQSLDYLLAHHRAEFLTFLGCKV